MGSVHFYRDEGLPLFEFKRCHSVNELSYKKHIHEEYSLGIIDQGKTLLWVEERTVPVEKNNLVLIPPNVVHACNPESGRPWRYRMLFVQAGWFERNLQDRPVQPLVRVVSEAKSLTRINRLLANFQCPADTLARETSMLSLFAEVLQNSGQERRLLPNEQKKMKVIQAYIQEHFLEKITLAELESVAGLNKFYLLRMFKRQFYIPPHAYQLLLRINYAKQELRKQRAAAAVAYEAGFYDQSHFNKAFKSYTGTTPDKYQQLS
ncbi:hypothetical protein P22_2647 [Propionispora sp. 2/2-37]|uniref:AraC family transcriptional regulator n=1 Tax=Propionispora sp. 2/2-37 TaxID=1677858 RepID=UPI0006BB7742|nr:AraC family transcriptional regulator [Propionispora sp. 2/2-37]CUH96557.1 hypothetical protein P22_2647 [Propionispora sp. 2/2-37]